MQHKQHWGKRVRVTKDCRDGHPADGAYGIYEGDFPISAVVKQGEEYKKYDYQAFMIWNTRQAEPIPELSAATKEGEVCWFSMTNPRLKLDDGSTIWGAECWWALIDKEDPPMEVLQKGMDETVGIMATLISILEQRVEQTDGIGDQNGGEK